MINHLQATSVVKSTVHRWHSFKESNTTNRTSLRGGREKFVKPKELASADHNVDMLMCPKCNQLLHRNKFIKHTFDECNKQ